MTRLINQNIYQARLQDSRATEQLVAVAIHEASHVVVSLALGFRVDEVSIKHDGTGRTLTARGQRIHTDDEAVMFAVSGMAGEKHYSKMPATDARFTGDLTSVLAAYPDADDDDIAWLSERAVRILSQWRIALDELALELLRKRTLDAEAIEDVIKRRSPFGYELADYWRTKPQWEDHTVTPSMPVAVTTFDTTDAIRALEDIKRRRDRGETLPRELAGMVARLESAQRQSTPTMPQTLQYSDSTPLHLARTENGFQHRRNPGYETRVLEVA